MVLKERSGYAFGKDKGYKNTPLYNLPRIHTRRKKTHKLTETMILAKNVANEICGLAPYEKKAIDMLKKGNDRRAKKFLKIRLGNIKRTKQKFSALSSKMME